MTACNDGPLGNRTSPVSVGNVATREDARPGGLSVPAGWQPIETAPKDGTNILVFYTKASVDFCHIAWWDNGEFYKEQGYQNIEDATGWWSYIKDSFSSHKLNGYDAPTHWMPLPQPPKENE